MPPETVQPPPDVVVTVPSIDTIGFFENFFQWVVDVYPGFITVMKQIVGILIGISIPLSIALVIGIIYCVERLKTVRRKEAEVFDMKVEPAYEEVVAQEGDTGLAKRWKMVSDHIASPNPNDWKQAIIEADIILDEILTKLGYRGETIGEKLKRAHPGDFTTLEDAWAAHKARNAIAHEGSAFSLNHHEAKQVFQQYKKVFEEFYYV